MKSKILSVILILFMIVLSTVPALAEDTESKKLEELILKVKQILDIPEQYNNFTYSSNETEQQITLWNLNWENTKGDSNISVSIDSDGNFHSYNKYIYSKDQTGTGNYSKSDCKKQAEEFLQKVIPNRANQLKEDTHITYRSYDNHTFRYKLYIKDIPVEFSSVTVEVNKYTNEVVRFNSDGLEDLDYPQSTNIINLQEATKLYLDRVGISLKYYSYYDYNTRRLKVFPAYSLDSNNISIDSNTGKLMNVYNHYYNFAKQEMSADEVGNAGGARVSLNPEEIAEIENTSTLISKQKAESIVRENIDLINDDTKLESISLGKSYIDNKYIYSLYFDNAYAQVNASSGELIAFSSYKTNEAAANSALSQSKAKEIAQQFLEKISSDKLKQTKYKESYIVENPEKDTKSSYNFEFVRQINGMDFVDNYLSIDIDKNTGDITNYWNKWYDDVEINDIGYIITDEDAFNKLNEIGNFGLSYTMIDENKVGLVYKFTTLDNGYLLDPIKAIRIDYKGEEYIDETSLPEYSDIQGHWCEEYVTKLLENGYYIKSEKFNPNNRITQSIFLKYLYSTRQNSFTEDEFYKNLIEKGIITKEEVAPNSYITIEEAAKFITRYMGYDKIAIHSEIFTNLFENKISDEYKGYVTICYALKIIDTATDNTMKNKDNVTNAQAAKMIYTLINLK